MANGLYTSLVIFFLSILIMRDQAYRPEGQTPDMSILGTTMFTCIVCAVNIQILFTMNYFTWIQHVVVWGSIFIWYLLLVIYGSVSPLITGNPYSYKVLVEALGPAPIYWTITFLVTVVCNLPFIMYTAYTRCFQPMDHHIIQEIKYYKKDIEDQRMWRREKSKARQKTKIGIQARVDAKIRKYKEKLQRKYSTL